ncbi:MAG: amidohydrolase family protein [Phycisphaerae bacterium]|nr:amidohydrolase family protein [Phycisphaerae bacterium]
MICDLETRVWASPMQLGDAIANALRRPRTEVRLQGTPYDAGHEEAHVAAMRPVARAFVLGFRSVMLGAEISNEYVAQVTRRRADRLVAVAGIDPMAPSWHDDLDRAIANGHVAVTVSPACQGYPPSHSAAMLLWEACAERRLPVIVSKPGTLPAPASLECDRPLLWDEPLRAIPELTLVFAGLGAPFVEETLVLLAKHERTFASLAGAARRPIDAYRWLLAAHDAGVSERLLFASGFPFDTPASALERLYTLNALVLGTTLPGIPRRDIERIVERNAFDALGIRDPIAHQPAGDQVALLAAARSLLSDR